MFHTNSGRNTVEIAHLMFVLAKLSRLSDLHAGVDQGKKAHQCLGVCYLPRLLPPFGLQKIQVDPVILVDHLSEHLILGYDLAHELRYEMLPFTLTCVLSRLFRPRLDPFPATRTAHQLV